MNPTTGAVTTFVTSATITTTTGITQVNLNAPIVGAEGGILYTASDGSGPQVPDAPDAIFKIDASEIPSVSVLESGDPDPFRDLDVFMTRAPNGDLIIADDSNADTIHRVTTPAGDVSPFLSEAALEATDCVSGDVDLEGGIAFDDAGNFYLAEENTDSIYKFDTALNCSTFVTSDTIKATTGITPDLDGGIAFAPCITIGGVMSPVDRLGLLAPWVGLAALGCFVLVGSTVVLKKFRG